MTRQGKRERDHSRTQQGRDKVARLSAEAGEAPLGSAPQGHPLTRNRARVRGEAPIPGQPDPERLVHPSRSPDSWSREPGAMERKPYTMDMQVRALGYCRPCVRWPEGADGPPHRSDPSVTVSCRGVWGARVAGPGLVPLEPPRCPARTQRRSLAGPRTEQPRSPPTPASPFRTMRRKRSCARAGARCRACCGGWERGSRKCSTPAVAPPRAATAATAPWAAAAPSHVPRWPASAPATPASRWRDWPRFATSWPCAMRRACWPFPWTPRCRCWYDRARGFAFCYVCVWGWRGFGGDGVHALTRV